jgi:hypothetical protein
VLRVLRHAWQQSSSKGLLLAQRNSPGHDRELQGQKYNNDRYRECSRHLTRRLDSVSATQRDRKLMHCFVKRA